MKLHRHILLLLAFLFCSGRLAAQIFPIANNFYIQAGSSPVVSDLCNSINPKLNIVLQNKDFLRPQIDCRLWIRIEGSNGEVLETKQGFSAPIPITLFSGQIQTLSGDELAPYLAAQNMNISGMDVQQFLRNGTLPEGNYTFRIRVFRWNGPEQLSAEAVAMGFFNLSDPPLLSTPMDGSAVQALTPQSVLFSWSPRHSPLPDNSLVEYKMELWEILLNRNPQEAALFQQPIQTITTFNLNQLYAIEHTVLDTGKTYAWRVRAQTANGKGYFRNNGYSEVQTFRYLSPKSMPYTDAPTNFELMRTNLANAEFRWNTDPRYQGYRLEYRLKNGNRWIPTMTNTGEGIANQLEPDREYQARVQGYNAAEDIYGFYSNTINFRTPKVPIFKCGETPDNKPLPTRPPLAKARKGDVFKMGGFHLYCTKVEGGGGIFRGEGIVNVPFLIQILAASEAMLDSSKALRTGFAVVFNNITVDDDYNIVSGRVDVVSKGWKSMMAAVMDEEYNASVGSVRTGAPAIAGKVDFSLEGVTKAESVKEIKDSTGKVVGTSIKIKDPATGKETEIKASSMPANVQDKNGKTYSVDVDGNIKSVGEPSINFPSASEANTIVDASKGSVKWENTNKSNYFLDDKTDSKIAKTFADKYKHGILTQGSETAYAPWKSIADGASEPIQATVTILDPSFNKDSVIFITGKGLKYVATTTDKKIFQINLSAPPAGDMQELYCRVKDAQGKWQTIGKLLVEAFPKRERTVVLVPIAGATIDATSKNTFKTELNKIYNGANAYWDVQVADSMPISSLGITAITAESKLFPCYSPEMRKINSLLKTKDYYTNNDKVSYVFVVGNKIQKPSGVDGEMPRGKQFGYIFGTPTATFLAHELGHGQYKFKHTFSEIPELAEGTTTPKNVEDYAPGSYLYKYQWDQIHFPLQDEFVCLDSDKEGQIQLAKGEYLGFTPNGYIIKDRPIDYNGVFSADDSYFITGFRTKSGGKYTWDGSKYVNGSNVFEVKNNTELTGKVAIWNPNYKNKCFALYKFIEVDKYKPEQFNNIQQHIQTNINGNWIAEYSYLENETQRADCIKEAEEALKSLNGNTDCSLLSDIKMDNPGSIAFRVNRTKDVCLKTIKTSDRVAMINALIPYLGNIDETKGKSAVENLNRDIADKKTFFSNIFNSGDQYDVGRAIYYLTSTGIENSDFQTEIIKIVKKDQYSLLVKMLGECDFDVVSHPFIDEVSIAFMSKPTAPTSTRTIEVLGDTLTYPFSHMPYIIGLESNESITSAKDQLDAQYTILTKLPITFNSDGTINLKETYFEFFSGKSAADMSTPSLFENSKSDPFAPTVFLIGKGNNELGLKQDNVLLMPAIWGLCMEKVIKDHKKARVWRHVGNGAAVVGAVGLAAFSGGSSLVVAVGILGGEAAVIDEMMLLSKDNVTFEQYQNNKALYEKWDVVYNTIMITDGLINAPQAIQSLGGLVQRMRSLSYLRSAKNLLKPEFVNVIKTGLRDIVKYKNIAAVKLGIRNTVNYAKFAFKGADEFLDIIIHFKNGKFYVIVEGVQVEKNIKEIVSIINNTPSGKTARLLSCNDEVAAIALSKETKKPFYASDGWVEINKNGDVYSKNDFHLYNNGNKGAKGSGYTKGKAPEGVEYFRLGDDVNNGGSILGNIIKNGNKIEYTNPAGKVLKWSEQGAKDIENSINTSKNLPVEAKYMGRITEAKVGEFVKGKKNLESYGIIIKDDVGQVAAELDVTTLDEIIEVKASFSSVKEDQFGRLLNSTENRFVNPFQKKVILYVDKPLSEATQAQINMINRIKGEGVTVVHSLEELGTILK